MPALAHYETILQTAQERYAILPLQGDACALITERGARVAGLFSSPGSENLLWTDNTAWLDAGHWSDFVAQGGWNLGGERIWIAPEIQYNVRTRADFWGTLHVPPAMDPGTYRLEPGQDRVDLQAQMSLAASNLATGVQDLTVHRQIIPVSDPLAKTYPVSPAVRYCGYQQSVALHAGNRQIVAEAWNLVQVPAGGVLLIPCLPEVVCSDYFGDVPDEVRSIQYGDVPYLRLTLNGKRQYKVGYQAASVIGRMGYLRRQTDGQMSLLIRSFFNNPSNMYAEEPPAQIGRSGHSIHVYNDGGEFGGDLSFGEMECTGTTLHAGSTSDHVEDSFVLWAYTGPEAAIQRIVHLLLGVRL